ncbi:Uncharacterized protein FWK35_00011251 [Aphis craccivora]|uniref:Uncharacterized protein n=1 Tax=Aphis craccivora TaxID=307492 RepID=A0A6G0Y692_APHCR|nr:Uncharacterized protein FWK35_00011251 [Aphis craccivora]
MRMNFIQVCIAFSRLILGPAKKAVVMLSAGKKNVVNSERSDECIDFTMLCMFFFFLCLCTRERVKIMLQFQTLGVVSDSKMNLVGALERSFFEFPNNFQKRWGKTKKKIKEKRELLRKTSFRPNRFFYIVFKFLQNLSKTQKFSINFEIEKS